MFKISMTSLSSAIFEAVPFKLSNKFFNFRRHKVLSLIKLNSNYNYNSHSRHD